MTERHLVLRSYQSPGDGLMLTAAVRDLHSAHPGRFVTDVRSSAPGLWANNPHLTPLREGDPDVQTLEMHYPLIHESNQRPLHFIHGYAQYLEQQLGVKVPITRFHGDIHLAEEEKELVRPGGVKLPEHYWIVIAGGKYDFTAKWWEPERFQAVVDHFQGRICFVQCGEAGHWHPRLKNVVDLVGKTTTREFVRVMYRADGVLCPVTFAMHLAAAVPAPPGRPRHRACVVVAGGREPSHWEAYPFHQFISNNGALTCCLQGGCWKSRCQLVGDGDAKDRSNLCEKPVQVKPDLRIPRCMDMISPADVIRRIDLYYEGGALRYQDNHQVAATAVLSPTIDTARSDVKPPVPTKRVLIEFSHGLGDAAQFTVVLRHLHHYHPDWSFDVASLLGKHSAFHGLCDKSFVLNRDNIDRAVYDQAHCIDWHECRSAFADSPSTKAVRCLREVFGQEPIADLCSYSIQVGQAARQKARSYLASICQDRVGAEGRYPAVLIHYQGNTSGDKKDFGHEVARELCQAIQHAGFVPVILDWDRRSLLPDGKNIHCPGADHELWGKTGTGDAEALATLIELSTLMVGIDSGPLHVAGATTTPTIAVWTKHHPVHFFDLAPNVTHLVPSEHERLTNGKPALDYFARNYRHRVYRSLGVDLPALVESTLTGQDLGKLTNRNFLGQLRSASYDIHYYEEHKEAGLDYLAFGGWQQRYGRWFVDALNLQGKKLLDVGCACGAVLRGLGEAGAVVQGVELNEHMVKLGRDKWPDMAPLLHVCDAVNLHLFPDAAFDAIHSAQVAEHWKPELVSFILQELRRVTAPGGLFFCALDTEELFARSGRAIGKGEDPTHVCIKPMSWWHEELEKCGWRLCTSRYERPLREHRESMLKLHDWDWFVAQRMD